jgi:hypothetical protein
MLHARRLSIPHPAKGLMTFWAPWPEDFLALAAELERLEARSPQGLEAKGLERV